MFDYPNLDRIDSPNGRYYKTPDGFAPSVTTVLSKTSDQSWIADWRNRVGQEAADAISREAADLGTMVHLLMEKHFRGEQPDQPKIALQKLAAIMSRSIQKKMSASIGRIWGMETKLHFKNLYAGTADLVAEWDGEPAILDYKTGKSFKDGSGVSGFSKQCSAYALAHNNMFGTSISRIVVIECTRTADVRVTCISGKDFDVACDDWVSALERYHS